MISQKTAATSARPAPAAEATKAVIGLVAPSAAGLKARQLFQEARRASLEHVGELQSAIERVRGLLDDVVEGGEVYAPGLGEFAARLAEELLWKSRTLEALAQRHRLQVEGAAAH
jgi:hypothetical protein